MELNLNDLENFKKLKSGEKNLFKMIVQILMDANLLPKFVDFLVQLLDKIFSNDEKKTE